MADISEYTDDAIALSVILITMGVIAYQAVQGREITIPTEPAMIILGFYFGKRMTG